jgi:hypothetical protein
MKYLAIHGSDGRILAIATYQADSPPPTPIGETGIVATELRDPEDALTNIRDEETALASLRGATIEKGQLIRRSGPEPR